MSKLAKTRSRIIKVYHGTELWSPGTAIRAPAITYMLTRGRTKAEAIIYAEGLLVPLLDFSDRRYLHSAMLQAQRTGIYSPLVSTSRKREVARSFALSETGTGYIVTIEGPEDRFYDFNKIRNDNGLPQTSEHEWMQEMGIPLEVALPFEIVSVDKVSAVVEKKVTVYRK
jgi:hypothetical protein